MEKRQKQIFVKNEKHKIRAMRFLERNHNKLSSEVVRAAKSLTEDGRRDLVKLFKSVYDGIWEIQYNGVTWPFSTKVKEGQPVCRAKNCKKCKYSFPCTIYEVLDRTLYNAKFLSGCIKDALEKNFEELREPDY